VRLRQRPVPPADGGPDRPDDNCFTRHDENYSSREREYDSRIA
jgi:hypothetical protein